MVSLFFPTTFHQFHHPLNLMFVFSSLSSIIFLQLHHFLFSSLPALYNQSSPAPPPSSIQPSTAALFDLTQHRHRFLYQHSRTENPRNRPENSRSGFPLVPTTANTHFKPNQKVAVWSPSLQNGGRSGAVPNPNADYKGALWATLIWDKKGGDPV